jgi:hypothetical protein
MLPLVFEPAENLDRRSRFEGANEVLNGDRFIRVAKAPVAGTA